MMAATMPMMARGVQVSLLVDWGRADGAGGVVVVGVDIMGSCSCVFVFLERSCAVLKM